MGDESKILGLRKDEVEGAILTSLVAGIVFALWAFTVNHNIPVSQELLYSVLMSCFLIMFLFLFIRERFES